MMSNGAPNARPPWRWAYAASASDNRQTTIWCLGNGDRDTTSSSSYSSYRFLSSGMRCHSAKLTRRFTAPISRILASSEYRGHATRKHPGFRAVVAEVVKNLPRSGAVVVATPALRERHRDVVL